METIAMLPERLKWLSKKFRKFSKWWKEPPDHVLNQTESIKAALAADWREIIYIDLTIWVFLLSSVYQVAFIFGKGDPGLFSYTKSLGLDTTIWILSRAIAKSSILAGTVDAVVHRRTGSKKTIPHNRDWTRYLMPGLLWTGLLIIMAYTTTFNILFELWDPNAPENRIVFLETSGMEFVTRILSSSYLAMIVIFLTFVRMLRQRNLATTYEEATTAEVKLSADEQRKEAARERSRRWREQQKLELHNGRKKTGKKR